MGEESSETQPFTIDVGDGLKLVYDFAHHMETIENGESLFDSNVYGPEVYARNRALKNNGPHAPFTREQATEAVERALIELKTNNFGFDDRKITWGEDAKATIRSVRMSWTPVTDLSEIPGGPKKGYTYYQTPPGKLVRVPNDDPDGPFEFVD